ncbi:MAG: SWIM zinc finger domain-containing protein [Gemmataceae bacterium]|nr:SWIM zinc finger domain-containing protein [Gemmataceae bacterium]
MPPAPDTMTVYLAATKTTPAFVRVGGDTYQLAEIPCDRSGRRGFEVVRYRRKLAGRPEALARYAVEALAPHPDPEVKPDGVCDCPDGNFRGRPCKHIRLAVALWRAGKL